MSDKRTILRNLNWNWAGIIGDTIVSFLLCPWLLSHLGAERYGAWVMIGSLTGYFGLLDLGVRGSVGRYVAFYRARQDPVAAGEIVTTATLLLTVAGLLGAIGTALAGFWADRWTGGQFTPDELESLRHATLLAAANLGFLLPLNVADGVLWGCQRFDRLNAVRIPFDLGRGLLSALVVAAGGGLVALSAVALTLTVVSGVAKVVLARQAAPELVWTGLRIDRSRMKEVFSFGIWSSLRSLTAMIPSRVTPLLVGALLGVAVVAPLSIAARLIAASSALLVAATGVVTPIATALHARSDRSREHELLLTGGKYGLAASTIFLALFLLLGRPLIHLWVGAEQDAAYGLLVVLALGRWVSMSQVVTRGMITAQARHRALAVSSVVQAVLTVGLGLLLIRPYGATGMVVAIALGDALCEGLYSLVHGCRLVNYSIVDYLRRTIGPTALALAAPIGLLALAVHLRPVAAWSDLIAYGATFALTSVVAVAAVNERRTLMRRWRAIVAFGKESPCAT